RQNNFGLPRRFVQSGGPYPPHAGPSPAMSVPVDPSPIAARPTHARYVVMGFLLALSFLTYFDRQCIVWVKPAIQSQLALSDGQMGIVLGAFWLAYALFDPLAGWLGDRFGAKLALTRVVLA